VMLKPHLCERRRSCTLLPEHPGPRRTHSRSHRCSRPDLTCFDQPLGSGAERWEGIDGLHEIRLRLRGLLHHNICAGGQFGNSEGRMEIGGPIHQSIMHWAKTVPIRLTRTR
jgi:hypothetical protein